MTSDTKHSSNSFSSSTEFSTHICSSFALSGQILITNLHIFLFLPVSGCPTFVHIFSHQWKGKVHTHCEKCHIFYLKKAGIIGNPKRIFCTLSQSSLKPIKLGQMESLHQMEASGCFNPSGRSPGTY
jgi:hypothetical protein